MEYSIQNLSKTKVEISFDVPRDEWQEDIKKGYNKNKHKYMFKGFRKGKVPFHMAKENFLQDLLYDALNTACPEYFEDILKKENIQTVGEPDFDVKELSEDGLKMVIVVWRKPEFTLGQYTGLEIEKLKTDVSEEEINEVINGEAEKRSRLIDVDRSVKNGDIAVIDFSGSVDGVKFDGGTAEGYELGIGSGSFIPGFEEQIVGMEKGGERDVKVKFPEDYGAENLAGKDAVFAIKLHEIKEKELPAIDDEFAKDIDEKYNTLADWKTDIENKLKSGKEERVNDDLFNKILEKVAENTDMEIPECMIDDFINGNIEDMERRLKSMYNVGFEQYCKMMNTTVEEYRLSQRKTADKQIRFELIIGEIIKDSKIEPTKEEFDAELANVPEGEMTQEKFNGVMNKVMLNKLISFLKENNNII